MRALGDRWGDLLTSIAPLREAEWLGLFGSDATVFPEVVFQFRSGITIDVGGQVRDWSLPSILALKVVLPASGLVVAKTTTEPKEAEQAVTQYRGVLHRV